MSHIRPLPSGKFQAVIRVKGLKPIYKTFSTKAKAKAFAKKVESETELARNLSFKGDIELRQARQISTGKGSIYCTIPTFPEWVDHFIEQTDFKDQSMLGRLIFWKKLFKDYLVTDIEPEEIDDTLQKIYEDRTGSTVNRYKSNLSSVFNAFNKHPEYKRLRFSNPTKSEFVDSFPENPAKTRFLSPEEQNNLLKAAEASHWDKLYLLVLLALTSGARRSEMLNLAWTDINFKERTAKLDTSKNGEPRLLPLVPDVHRELMKFRENNNHLIFHSTIDPHSPFEFRKAWKNALRDSEIENCRFHDLRHTAASNMVASGKTLFETGTLLGHKQINTTIRYAHLAHHHVSKMADDVWEDVQQKM